MPTTFNIGYRGLFENHGMIGFPGITYQSIHDERVADTFQGVGSWQLLQASQTRSISGNYFDIRRGVFQVNTSSLPDGDTIASAKVRFQLHPTGFSNDYGTFTFNLVAGNPVGEYWREADCGVVIDAIESRGSIQSADIVADGVTWNEITLSHTALTEISKTGWTYFALRLSEDISSIAPPWPGYTVINGVAIGYTMGFQLVVTHGVFEVQTDAATSITNEGATLNGTLVDDAGLVGVLCSFEYGETTAFGITTTAVIVAEGASWAAAITGLDAGSQYYFRAKAVGNGSTDYGETLSFITGGSQFPTLAIARVTNLIHRFDRLQGIYNLEINIGDVTVDFPELSVFAQKKDSATIEKAVLDAIKKYYPTLNEPTPPPGL